MLAAIESAKFRQWVNPGETAMIEAIILVSRPQFAKAKCQVHVGEKLVATSELFFSFVASSQFAPGFRDPVLERYYTSQPVPSGQTS